MKPKNKTLGPPSKKKKWKWTKVKKPQLILLATLIFLCITILSNEILDLPSLLRGIESRPFDWIELATELSAFFIAVFSSTILLSRVESKRKQAEEALKRERDFSQSILETANSMIVCLDGDAKITVFNQECERVTGYRGEEVLGKSWPELFLPPDQRHPKLKSFAKWVRDHPRDQYEGPIVTKTGEIRTILWSNTSILGSDEEEVVAIAIGHDITERKKAEEALRNSEERFRTLYENAPIGIYRTTPDGRILMANPTLVQMLRFSSFDELASRNLEKEGFGAGYPRSYFKALIEQEGEVRGLESAWTTRDNSVIFVRENAKVIRGEDGAVLYYEGTIEDITERRRAEENLRTSEERYRLLFERNLAGVYRTTIDGQILDCNESFVHILGYDSKEELLSRSAWDIYPEPKDREVFISRLKGKRSLINHEICLKRKGGSLIWALENVSLVPGRDPGSSIIEGTLVDITERKGAEEALRESQAKLQSILSAAPAGIGMTINQTIKELNTRLCEIVGYSKEELFGKSVSIVYPSNRDYLSTRGEIYNQLRERGHSSIEASWQRKDGKLIYVLLNCAPLTPGDLSQGITFTVLDITERKQAEEKLREQKEVMETILENIPVMIAFLDSDSSHKWVNQAWEKNLGWSLAEAQSCDVLKELYPDPEYYQYVVDFISKAESRWGDFRTRRRDGTVLDTIWTNVPLSDGSNIGIGLDITERKRAEKDTQDMLHFLQTLIDTIPSSIFYKDTEGIYRGCNKAYEAFLGLKKEDIVGKSVYEVFPKNLADKYYKMDSALFRQPGKQIYEWQMNHADGSIHDVIFNKATYVNRDGTLAGLVGVMVDITERKRAEQALKESEEKFRTLAESAQCGITILQGEKTIYNNPAITSYTGYTEEELEHMNFWDMVHPDFKELVKGRGLSRQEGKPAPTRYEIPIITKNAEERWIDISVGTCELSGKPAVISTAFDITDRKKAEETLKKERQRLFSVLDIMPTFVYLQAPDHSVRFTNRKFRELFGDPGNRPCYEAFYGRKDPCDPCITLRVLETRTPQAWEWSSNEGRIYMIYEDLFPSEDDEDLVLEIGVDITERKRAEEALRQSEENFKALAENASDGILIGTGEEGWHVYANRRAVEITGYPIEELLKTRIRDLVHPDELPKLTERYKKRLAGIEVPKPYEMALVNKDDIKVPIEISPSRTIWQNQLADMVIFRDITERKRAERALEESEKKYRTLVETAQEGIGIVDPDENVAFTNQAFADLLGYNKDELLGLNLSQISDKEEFAKFRKETQKRQHGESSSYETKLYTKTGEPKYFSISATPLHDDGGAFTGTLGLLTDITEGKIMEAQLIQAERLSAVGTLAYGIAHEFNNILAGILGNAEFGLESHDPQDDKECFRIIMESCDRAKSITNSLLAFSRQREIKKEKTDVTNAVEAVLGLVERELEKQNIKVVRKFSVVPEIVCNLGELSQVALNMITNARDAMRPKGGTLTIEIGKKKDNIQIIFSDTGGGIPDSIKGRIFEPFVTTKGALGQSEIPGMGLGLFLSYGIISRYQGEIEVKSEVGKGSKFTIKIPISKNLLR